MMEYILYGLANTALFFVLGRVAYGCWPWEGYKTWHCTKGEIQYLRDCQTNYLNERNRR